MSTNQAIIANLQMYVGEDKLIQVTIYQSDGITIQNISGWALSFVTHAYGDPSAVYILKSTSSGGITLIDPTNGVLQISIDAVDTSSMFPGQYEFYLYRQTIGSTDVLTKGLFTLNSR